MRVLLVGGGTLGSVTPLLAVAEELGSEAQISFWGTRRGPERAFIEAAGIPFSMIPSGKFRRYWDIRNIVDPVIVLAAFVIAFVRLLHRRPDVVVGAGGFVQVPVGWAAWLLRIPIVIHQLDVRPGLANRLLAPFASVITVAFAESAARLHHAAEVVGIPVRRSIMRSASIDHTSALAHFALPRNLPTVLVIGGGTGARALNVLVVVARDELCTFVNVLHVTGRGRGEGEISNLKSQISNYRSFEVLTDELPMAYAAADVVIARAGMGTIAELAALGKCVVLIPMPGTHQEDNAAALAAHGAAGVWNERDLTPAEFVARLRAVVRSDTAARAAKLRTIFPEGAVHKLAMIIRNVARKH